MLGVTAGCATGPARYCPDDSVTRAQMATFLTRAFGLESSPPFGFVDIEGNTHTESIDALAAAGVTAGCATGPARYCPDDSVTRAQMATFLTRAITTGPLSVSIGSDTSRTVTGSFRVGISFTRSVTGFGLSDVRVVNGRASGFTSSGSGYEVTIVPTAEGTVVVRIPQGVARDAAGNPNQPSGLLVRTFGSGTHRDGPGFDVWNREKVVAAYRAEFEREEPDPGFTGNVADCEAGTTSQAFRDSVVQRVNWYRQMAGLDTVTERPEYSQAAQHAALMMSAQGRLSHYPGSDWACYTETGVLGARSSNLGLGGWGTHGIDRYMRDSGSNNLSVGHRRWILYPALQKIGTGNIPSASSHRGTNALYVLGDRHQGDVREQRGFVAWPPAGYVPAGTVWGRWSFQLPGGDVSGATVRVTDDHGPIPTEIINRYPIVWAVHGDSNSREFSSFPEGDYCYTVTISNVTVGGATQVPFHYVTCLIDPGTGSDSGRYLSPPVWSPDSTQIAYLRGGGIWTISADGANQRLFLLSGTMRWSPDGTRVAYGSNGIRITNTDGTGQQQLTDTGNTPVWSPDGTRIAYSLNRKGIWTVNTDGTSHEQLTTQGSNPVWLRDGTRIVYQTDSEIWTINTDGTSQQMLAEGIRSWKVSPDRSRIVYSAYSPSGPGTWIMETDGSNREQLATDLGFNLAWSPDSTRITHTNNGIWVTNTDGTNQQQLSTSGSSPAWSPDGTRIAYNEWGHQLWVVNADGTSQQQLSK